VVVFGGSAYRRRCLLTKKMDTRRKYMSKPKTKPPKYEFKTYGITVTFVEYSEHNTPEQLKKI
jgi:hypothetical protein